MKHLILYEDMNRNPQVGDYVYVKDEYVGDDQQLTHYLNNNIGVIRYIDTTSYPYTIAFENIPINFKKYFELLEKDGEDGDDMFTDMFTGTRGFTIEEILYYSDDKEDVETHMEIIKYNI